MDVPNQFQQITVRINQQRLITPLKQVADPFFPVVDMPGVTKADILHDFGKRNLGNLNGKMDMIRHAAEGMNPMAESFNSFLKKQIKPGSVLSCKKDILPTVAS